MKILFAASGSGGHVYPTLALLKEARKKHEVGYLVLKDGFEAPLIKKEKIPMYEVALHPQAHYYLSHPFEMHHFYQELKRMQKEVENYDALIVGGGFISFFMKELAKKIKKPLYLLEQNQILGDANCFSSIQAKAIFTSFKHTKMPSFLKKKEVYVGNPRSDEVEGYKRKYCLEPFRILFLAGSLGSSTFLNLFFQTLPLLPQYIYVDILTGKKQFEAAKEQSVGKNVHIYSYTNEVPFLMSRASVVLMRAGATSIAEALTLEIPMVLLPSPYVKHHHQHRNGEVVQNAGAAIMLDEKTITKEELKEVLLSLYQKKEKLLVMHENCLKLKKTHVCKTILSYVEKEHG